MTIASAVAALLLPLAVGVVAGAVRLFDDPDAAVRHLNRFALYVAFPALIYVGLAAGREPVPSSVGFWAAVPLALLLALVPLKALGDRLGGVAGTLALVVSFGNVAYLGLPVVEAVLGPDAMASASLLVGVHVVVSLTLGQVLLLTWSGRDGASAVSAALAKLRTQPLFWAPLAGVAARFAPAGPVEASVAVVGPLGKAAAPAALFLLGLHLHTHRARLAQVDRVAVAHVVAKGMWLPLTSVVAVMALTPLGLAADDARIVLLLSAMPPAITTFAIATEQQIGQDRMAQAVVAGTTLAALTVPVVAYALLAL